MTTASADALSVMMVDGRMEEGKGRLKISTPVSSLAGHYLREFIEPLTRRMPESQKVTTPLTCVLGLDLMYINITTSFALKSSFHY